MYLQIVMQSSKNLLIFTTEKKQECPFLIQYLYRYMLEFHKYACIYLFFFLFYFCKGVTNIFHLEGTNQCLIYFIGLVHINLFNNKIYCYLVRYTSRNLDTLCIICKLCFTIN